MAMNPKFLTQPSTLVILFLIAIGSLAFTQNNPLLILTSVITGLFFLSTLRSSPKNRFDEREKVVRDKAAHITYMIFTPTIGLGSCVLMILGRQGFYYLESLGIVLAYLSLFQIVLYAIAFFYINREYGGNSHEE